MSTLKAVFLGLCLASIVPLITGCDLLGGESASGEVKLSEDTPTEVKAGESIALKGTLEASEKIDKVQYILYNSDGKQNPKGLKVDKKEDVKQDDEKKVDLEKAGIKILSYAKLSEIACKGSYTLRIEVAVEEGVVADKDFEFTVEGPECDDKGDIVTDLETATVTMGAQEASSGSSIDLDNFKVYDSKDAKAKSGDIDLYFGKLSNGPTMMSPAVAATNGFTVSGWEKKNDTKFIDLQVTLSTIKSSYQIDALWKSEEHENKLVISEGKTLVVKTNKGAIKVIEISEMDPTSSSMEIKVKAIKKKS